MEKNIHDPLTAKETLRYADLREIRGKEKMSLKLERELRSLGMRVVAGVARETEAPDFEMVNTPEKNFEDLYKELKNEYEELLHDRNSYIKGLEKVLEDIVKAVGGGICYDDLAENVQDLTNTLEDISTHFEFDCDYPQDVYRYLVVYKHTYTQLEEKVLNLSERLDEETQEKMLYFNAVADIRKILGIDFCSREVLVGKVAELKMQATKVINLTEKNTQQSREIGRIRLRNTELLLISANLRDSITKAARKAKEAIQQG